MVLYGITFAIPKSLGYHAKVFGSISQRLWGIGESLSHTNVYTTLRERLYHRKLWFVP